jgi:hypothetical protein
MAKAYEAPPGVEIAALKNKKTTGPMDLMMPGDGTPWEDRGNLGLVKAFIQTCVSSITKPARLLDHIRRPDTTGEATQFSIACSVLWAISGIIHSILYHWKYPPPADWELGEGNFYMKALLTGLLLGAAVYVLGVMFASRMYFAMVSTELKNAAPRALLQNMFSYSLGPSILAPIPVIGPPLALLFIFIAWITGGAKRLYISWRGSIVASVLAMLISLVAVGVGAFVANIVLNNMLGLGEPEWYREEQERMAQQKQVAPTPGSGSKVQP